ncbi:hypothetical protein [Wolbachia endosymbiont (group A) of Bombylius major]|uniref:hypothetical protein n=1 Tax=Wolbachia endosymbiont (group A) of Bombylius major TaxID=2953988 RepID=UPI002230C11D|nr:hypothetical protein [Wolbachia endosymbiont (group A) of Bombylius major]
MAKHEFIIDKDNQDKTAIPYYRLFLDNNDYVIHSHLGRVKIPNCDGLKLRWNSGKKTIVLYQNESPLKLDGDRDFIIGQDDIIGNKDRIISILQSTEQGIDIILHEISGNNSFGMSLLSPYKPNHTSEELGLLKFVDYNDKNDQSLQYLKKGAGKLNIRIVDNQIDISQSELDKNSKDSPQSTNYSETDDQDKNTEKKNQEDIDAKTKAVDYISTSKEYNAPTQTEEQTSTSESFFSMLMHTIPLFIIFFSSLFSCLFWFIGEKTDEPQQQDCDQLFSKDDSNNDDQIDPYLF